MIYTGNPKQDFDNIAHHINVLTKTLGVEDVQVDGELLEKMCYNIYRRFPHVDGLDKSSVFKKAGNFVAHFLQFRPIKSSFSPAVTIGELNEFDPNAVVAFDIAMICIQGSEVHKDNASCPQTVSNALYLSDHSYQDIIEALSLASNSEETHYKLITVLLEQITYKTNSHIEYKAIPGEPGYYQESFLPTAGDEMMGV